MNKSDTPDVAAAIPARMPARMRDIEPLPPMLMRETDSERAEREAMSRKHRHDRYMRRLPKRYESAALADLHPTEQDPGGRVSQWLPSGHLTLLLASAQPGLGKTHAAYAVGSQAVAEGMTVEAYTAMELLSALRPDGRDPSAPADVLNDVLTCDLLVLDDLGRERVTDWAQEQVHHVLSTRLGAHLRTIITTNLSADEVGKRYGSPLLDRLLDDAVVVKVTGTSRRKVADW